MLRRGRSFVTAVGTTRGSPDMVVGSNLSLQSVGAPFDGTGYYVTMGSPCIRACARPADSI